MNFLVKLAVFVLIGCTGVSSLKSNPTSTSTGYQYRAPKMIPFEENLLVAPKAKEVVFGVSKGEVVVTEVVAEFGDGTTKRLFSLEGKIDKNQQKSKSIEYPDKTVTRLSVRAYSTNLLGERGVISVRTF